MRKIRDQKMNIRFHTPNGLQCKFLGQELAEEMRATGFRTMRLSLESVSPERQKDMSMKVDTDTFARAAEAVHKAGFAINDLDAYIMMALPGQPLYEVLQTMAFVHTNRIGIRLAAYSPIPGTQDYQRAIDAGFSTIAEEPLLTNNSAIPVCAPGLTYETYNRVALLAKTLNRELHKSARPFCTEKDVLDRLCLQFTDDELFSVVLSGQC
ncbi:MAG: radical SAM protein [bacterium]